MAKWRIRVSIPVPPRCKRGTLPIELIPLVIGKTGGSCGIRTHAYKCRLELESSALDHSAKKPFTRFSAGSFRSDLWLRPTLEI